LQDVKGKLALKTDGNPKFKNRS